MFSVGRVKKENQNSIEIQGTISPNANGEITKTQIEEEKINSVIGALKDQVNTYWNQFKEGDSDVGGKLAGHLNHVLQP